VSAPATPADAPAAPAHRRSGATSPWQVFRTAAELGWRIESNWADPFIFMIYSIAKPLAHAAILVVMYAIVSRGDFRSPLFTYIFVGNAFYIYVSSLIVGVSWAVIEDRERYRTLKYIYVAPLQYPVYLMGRGMARFLTGTLSVVLTLGMGMLVLKLPLDPGVVDWPLFAAAMALGLVVLAMMGLIVAGVSLLVAHHLEQMGEALAGALYIFSGAVFPIDVLPGWLQPAAFAMPITWWLELVRRSLTGPLTTGVSPAMAGFSNGAVLGILAGLTVVTTAGALVIFSITDRGARERGLLDKVTNY
jgi:ABC-2 type transport system permease protein